HLQGVEQLGIDLPLDRRARLLFAQQRLDLRERLRRNGGGPPLPRRAVRARPCAAPGEEGRGKHNAATVGPGAGNAPKGVERGPSWMGSPGEPDSSWLHYQAYATLRDSRSAVHAPRPTPSGRGCLTTNAS